MERYLSMIIDTQKFPLEYAHKVERVMFTLDTDIKLKETVDNLMEKHHNHRIVTVVARELGVSRMAIYRLYERLDKKSPSPDPPPAADLKVCPYCGSEKWEKVGRLYHCLNSECGLEFRGPYAYRRYAFVSASISKEAKQ